MRVFVTGAAGFIGRAVVQELLSHGHQVLGLARSDANANSLKNAGAEVHRGSLEDLESLKSGAKATDGVIHLAFVHDFSNFTRATAADRAAIGAMADAMAGTGNPLVITSGTMMAPSDQLATEDMEPMREDSLSDRYLSEDLLQHVSKEKDIRGMVVRLPPSVHGKEDKGVVPTFTDMARKNGVVNYVGDGSGRWPTAHRLDVAVLYRLAFEKGTVGAVYHAVAEQGIKVKDVMGVIAKHLKLSVGSKSEDEVKDLGFMALFLLTDNPTSSQKTQVELGWQPAGIGLIQDIEANYFA